MKFIVFSKDVVLILPNCSFRKSYQFIEFEEGNGTVHVTEHLSKQSRTVSKLSFLHYQFER